MFSTPFDYEKIDWSQLLKKEALKGDRRSMKGSGEDSPFYSPDQEGEGIGQALKEKVPKFLASPVGREITKGIREISTSVASGSSIGTAIRKTGRKAVRNLIGIGAKNNHVQDRRPSTRSKKQTENPVRSTRTSPRKRLHFIPPLN